MIRSFKHRGLKALYEGRSSAKVTAGHVPKLTRILTALDEAAQPGEMDFPGFQLHPLKGDLKGHYAVSVSGNWRVTFRFEDGHAVDVDYVDYH
jgi:proteic killer suppression protein